MLGDKIREFLNSFRDTSKLYIPREELEELEQLIKENKQLKEHQYIQAIETCIDCGHEDERIEMTHANGKWYCQSCIDEIVKYRYYEHDEPNQQ